VSPSPTPLSPKGSPALGLHEIDKRFAGVIALDHAELKVDAGTVHALLGENGAGKTTLMRIAYGMLQPDAGTIVINGVERRLKSPAQAIAAGVGMVHQHYALVQAMSVADNVALGLSGRYEPKEARDRVLRLSRESGLELDPKAIVGDLSVEVQQRVEIVKALARDAEILILDEPTAVLAPQAALDLLHWVRRFADGGRSAVLITHKLREALAVADAVTVLRRGRTVKTVSARATNEAELSGAMLGSTLPEGGGGPAETVVPSQGNRGSGAAVLVAENITLVDDRGVTMIEGASFTVRGGEILGIAAVDGAGQHELLRALAGRHPLTVGRLDGPADVGFVPEDRQRDALVLNFPLYENVALRGAGSRRGTVPWHHMRDHTLELMGEFDVRAESEGSLAATLSGGNQQRLVLARELDGRPRVLVAENPTRGLDIQAMAAVHERLRAARDQGMAVVLYAGDLDEVLALADRVLVIADHKVREVPLDRELVGRAMLGLLTVSSQ
jgi:simple sugar transport system ATP-binding protein